MSRLVVDASVAIKWAVQEEGFDLAVLVRARHDLMAPELMISECTNILWKKVARGVLTRDEALDCAEVIATAGVSLAPTAPLMADALRLAVQLGHPAYDCFYLALSQIADAPLVTADERLRLKLAGTPFAILSLAEAAVA